MSKRRGSPIQAIQYAIMCGDDADSFLKCWTANDLASIQAAWPKYFAWQTGADAPDWYGKFDDQVISDCASEAYSDGEGGFSVSSFKRELDDAGLCIVGRGYNYPDLIKRLEEALEDHDSLDEAFTAADLTILPVERDRGDGRKAHYGDGEQPWDTSKRVGWGAVGAAFSILRYLRRTKQPERDLAAAKVYYGWLFELAQMDKGDIKKPDEIIASMSLFTHRILVQSVLTIDECERLGVPAANMLY